MNGIIATFLTVTALVVMRGGRLSEASVGCVRCGHSVQARPSLSYSVWQASTS